MCGLRTAGRNVPLIHVRIGDEELALALEDWEERVRAGRVPEDALVRFEAVTGDAWLPARDLESYRSLRDDAAIAWQEGFLRGPPPLLTAALVGVQIRIWIWSWVPGNTEAYLRDLTNFAPPTYEDGQIWRLLTTGLLHVELFHLALNMLWLAYTGWNLERALGRANLALIYTASVAGGALLSMVGSPATRSLGASGGVFGLVAASVVFGFLRPDLLPERGRRLFGIAMLPYLLLMFWSGLMNEGTDNWGHTGGLVVGGLLALVLDPAPLQRRPGWNRRWQVGVLSVLAAVAAALGVFGPRLHPLPHAQIVRFAGSPTMPSIDPDAPLEWHAPAGWRSDVGPAGDPGFGSPAGARSWSVVEQSGDAPIAPEALLDRWLQRLRRGWPDAEVDEPVPTELAGRPGLAVRVRIDTDDGPVVVEWRGTTRGVHTLQEVWSVEAHREARLAPLRDRLRARVRWGDPVDLATARRDAKATPRSRRARTALADALLRAGEPEASLAIRRELLAEASDRETWRGLLTLARWYPEAVDAEALWADALRDRPEPLVILEVARGLEAAGRDAIARGLLDIAWGRSPGDHLLRHARRTRGLSTALTDDHLPWHLAREVTGADRPPGTVEALLGAPLTLEAAAERAEWLAQERDRATTLALEGLRAGTEAALQGLLVLKHGHLPDDRADAAAAVLAELEAGAPDWLPPSVTEAIPDPGEVLRPLVGAWVSRAQDPSGR